MTDRSTVEKIFAEAAQVVEAAEIPEDLRPVAFGKAVDLLAGTAAPAEGALGAHQREEQQTANGNAGERIARIAKKLGIESETAEYFFDAGDDDDVTLNVPRSKLNSQKSGATREVALLYCAARQAGGYDDSHTSVVRIKGKVSDMGVLDAPNFATHIKDVEGLTVRGSGSKREYKMTSHGFEETTKVVNRIKGGGS